MELWRYKDFTFIFFDFVSLIVVVYKVSKIIYFLLNYFVFKFLSTGGLVQKLPNNLKCLSYLKILAINFGAKDVVTSALCLIRSSPNIRTLCLFVSAEPCICMCRIHPRVFLQFLIVHLLSFFSRIPPMKKRMWM